MEVLSNAALYSHADTNDVVVEIVVATVCWVVVTGVFDSEFTTLALLTPVANMVGDALKNSMPGEADDVAADPFVQLEPFHRSTWSNDGVGAYTSSSSSKNNGRIDNAPFGDVGAVR